MVLVCEVTFANPETGLEFAWSLNGTSLNETYVQQISKQEGRISKIIIPAGEEELFGTWTCSVQNNVGRTDPNCTLFVDAPLGSLDLLDSIFGGFIPKLKCKEIFPFSHT